MKNLQESILNQYRDVYPKESLKEIALKTEIERTRVFRIMNGSEMKISEYEAFERCVNQKVPYQDFFKKAKECSIALSPARLKSIYTQMNHALKISSLKSCSLQDNFAQTLSNNLELA